MVTSDTKTLELTIEELWNIRAALRIRIHSLRDDIARYDLSADCKACLYEELAEYETLMEKVREQFGEQDA